MRPAEVVRFHGDLQERLRDDKFRRMVHASIGAQYESRIVPARAMRWTNQMFDSITGGVPTAEDFLVTGDMVEVLKHAAAKLEPEDVWDHTLAPSPSGFVRFEKPIAMKDVRGTTMLVHWATWRTVWTSFESVDSTFSDGYSTVLSFWNDPIDEPDDQWKILWQSAPEMMERATPVLGRFAWVGAEACLDGRPVGEEQVDLSEDEARIIGLHGIEPQSFTNVRRYVMALWLMLGQTITKVTEEETPRAVARRYRKMELPKFVTVVALRRVEYKGDPHGESHVEWSHRWLVRGHWRWQPYGDGSVRRIWIAGYVKGPEDKPLVLTRTVNVLSR